MKQEDRITVYQTEEKPCLTTGHRLYVIGGQNGMFPQKGEHRRTAKRRPSRCRS